MTHGTSIDKFTPGPWEVEKQAPGQNYTRIGGPVAKIGGDDLSENVEFIVGTCGDWGQHGDEQTEANAHLVSAAPDLLEACKALVGACEGFPEVVNNPGIAPCISLAHEAMRKAGGK